MFEPNSNMNAKLYAFLVVVSTQMLAVVALVLSLR